MAGYRLRRATSEDSDALYALHRVALGPYVEAIYGPWDDAVQRRFHRDWFDPHRLWVIEVDGELVGVLDCRLGPDLLEVDRIAIAPSHQRRGIGTAVLSDLLAHADRLRVPTGLEVFDINPARRLYERLGFAETGREDRKVHMLRPTGGRPAG